MILYCARTRIKPFIRVAVSFFIAAFLLNGFVYAQGSWKEQIAISGYHVEHSCSYRGMSRNPTYNSVQEEYIINLQSKYSMFANYNNYQDGLIISTALHDVRPSYVKFHSRAGVQIHLDGPDFDKLIQANGFSVYYPSSVFDEKWKRKLADNSAKSNSGSNDGDDSRIFIDVSAPIPLPPASLLFFSDLSSVGLDQFRKSCHETIAAQKKAFEVQEEENNKPINRLKNFFGV